MLEIHGKLKLLEWEVTNDSEELKTGITTNGFWKYIYQADQSIKKYGKEIYKKYELVLFEFQAYSLPIIGQFDTLEELKETAQLLYEQWIIDNFIDIKE